MSNSPFTIWQYWETSGSKPPLIDTLHDLAKLNSGANVVRVTPETLEEYLPDLSPRIREIPNLAHKADMIRTRLLCKYGGMWLDSDAIVLKRIRCLFRLLRKYEFIGFNDQGRLTKSVRVNCFLAQPNSIIMRKWVAAQETKLPRVKFKWTELGTRILGPLCLRYHKKVKILPFETISPIQYTDTNRFICKENDPNLTIRHARLFMLHHHTLKRRQSSLLSSSSETILSQDHLLAFVLRQAVRVGETRPRGQIHSANP